MGGLLFKVGVIDGYYCKMVLHYKLSKRLDKGQKLQLFGQKSKISTELIYEWEAFQLRE